MKAWVRGAAVLFTAAALLVGAGAAFPASAQDQAALTAEGDKVSYMVGHDIARSIAPVAPDLDLAAFQRAISNAFAKGEPLLDEAEAQATGQALMARVRSRVGQLPAGTPVPEVDKDKVGYLVGADVGRSLLPIRDELSLPVLMRGVRDTFANATLALDEAEMARVRQAFTEKVTAQQQAKQARLAETNLAAGAKFLAENKQVKGVFTTPSGLQYMVLRQGSGPRPQPGARVRVNYEGRLLDGTVFDSSYERGEPTEFGLDQVIAGWAEGVALMPVGAKYRFWIPSEIAYGKSGVPGGEIGPNATLAFDVELQAILP